MLVKIIETGEQKRLNIFEEGVNWTTDLILNVDDLCYNEEEEMYEMTVEQYNWWEEYIRNYESDEQEAKELAEEIGIDEQIIWDEYNTYHSNDYGDHHGNKQHVFEEIRKQYGHQSAE